MVIDIEGVIPDPDEQDPNLQDENDAEDEIKQEQVNLDDPTKNIIKNDEPIINQPPILGDIPNAPNENVRRSTRTPVQRTPYEPSMTRNKYLDTTATTLNQTMHTDTHMQLNLGPSWDQVVHYAMTQISMKPG